MNKLKFRLFKLKAKVPKIEIPHKKQGNFIKKKVKSNLFNLKAVKNDRNMIIHRILNNVEH
jgi:hypothetical protein